MNDLVVADRATEWRRLKTLVLEVQTSLDNQIRR